MGVDLHPSVGILEGRTFWREGKDGAKALNAKA